MSKRAVILAGGMGTRLRPYTVVLPKPLMPVGEYPILEVIVRQLAYHGFTHITLAVNHQANLIKAFFGNGENWNIKIDYSLEDKPLSTMAPLKLVKDLPENFLVMNGDILSDINYGSFYDLHCKQNNIFTISAAARVQVSEYGVLVKNEENQLIDFKEKPKQEFLVSMGVYMVSKQAVDIIPADTVYGFDHLMLELIKQKRYATIKEHNGYWLDIGRPDDYAQAIEEFEQKKSIFLK